VIDLLTGFRNPAPPVADAPPAPAVPADPTAAGTGEQPAGDAAAGAPASV
jgi:hypothetical protein